MTRPPGRTAGRIPARLRCPAWVLGLVVHLAVVLPAVVHAQPPPQPATERAEILERLGVVSLQRRDYAEAARYFRAAIAAGRDHWQIRQNLGFALLSLDRCEEAVTELEISARQSPAPRSFIYLARCYERLKKPGRRMSTARWATSTPPRVRTPRRQRRGSTPSRSATTRRSRFGWVEPNDSSANRVGPSRR